MLEFWELTPKETTAAIEAATWRLEQEHRGRVWLAWHVAALSRARRMPPLAKLLQPADAKPLDGEERERLRAEFEELTKRFKWPGKGKGKEGKDAG